MDKKQTNEKKKLTTEQKEFYLIKTRLQQLDELERQRDLNLVELHEKNDLNTRLWEKMIRYARSLSATSTRGYALPNDYLDDLVQALALKFYINFPKYDPLVATPTTFFHFYFLEAIGEYKRNDSQNGLSANDANNIARIKRAIKQHELLGEAYDVSILSIDTGLSVKVVKKTLNLMNNALVANIDNMLDLKSTIPQPEEVALNNELNEELYSVIDSTLTAFEKKIFFSIVNLEGEKSRKYKEVAAIFNIPIHEVKALWNSIITRLANNPILKKYSPTIDPDDLNLNTHTLASDMMEIDIINTFTDEE